ncbi:hypothetical protein T4D_1402 [Trichinella pseudospiralis]|uniref:Uncharacterized protein n=1 Tax=Trichinella pseudospiralis TaxID=6337 RepID=A0A0V1F8X7_TRIPS|nr:hypothetical protein T4D_1402 [Trichinella pseudospiralis]
MKKILSTDKWFYNFVQLVWSMRNKISSKVDGRGDGERGWALVVVGKVSMVENHLLLLHLPLSQQPTPVIGTLWMKLI